MIMVMAGRSTWQGRFAGIPLAVVALCLHVTCHAEAAPPAAGSTTRGTDEAAAHRAESDEKEPTAGSPAGAWWEDFSDQTAFQRQWHAYGFLASGVDAKHPQGTPVSGDAARPDWWQIVDGSLRGQNFPEEHHPPGIWRKISGQDVRISLRFRFAAGGMAGITVRGPNPIVDRDFHVAVLHIRPGGVTAGDNTVLHPKDSPEAAALKRQGIWNRKFFYAKTEKSEIAPDEWHTCTLELCGRDLTAFIDGRRVLDYATLAGDAPKSSIGLQPGGDKKRVLATWFDDIRVEPLPSSAGATK